MAKETKGYVELVDGKWYHFTKTDYLICCDCNLVHKMKFKVENGKIFIKLWRDERSTSAYRRWKKKWKH